MAIAIRSQASSTADNADVTVSVPAGTVDNDQMLAVVCNRNTTGNLTDPTGWTRLFGPLTSPVVRVWVLRRTALSEPASYLFDIDTPDKGAAGIVSYSGVDTAAPINASASGEDSDGTPATSPLITPTVNNCMIVSLSGAWGFVGSTPDTDPVATERIDEFLPDFGPRVYVQDFLQGTAAAISLDHAIDGQVWELVTIALKPAAATASYMPAKRRGH